jgi:hypothetical protein
MASKGDFSEKEQHMPDDIDDGVEIPEEPDFEACADVFGEELWTETREVCDRAHKLLGGGNRPGLP